MTDEKRVILIKPGDVLLIGGAELADEQAVGAMRQFREMTGLDAVLVFADDIQIDALTREQIAQVIAAGQPDIRWEYGMPDGDEPDGMLPLDGTPRIVTPRMVRRPLAVAGPWEPALRIAPECSTSQRLIHAECDGCDCRCHTERAEESDA